MKNKTLCELAYEQMIAKDNTVDVTLGSPCFSGKTMKVKTSLGMEDAMGFVASIVSDCVDYDDAAYMPEVLDFAIRLHAVQYYTDLDIPDDLAVMYALLYETHLFDDVYENIHQHQFRKLVSSAQERIAHEREMMVSTASDQVRKLVSLFEQFASGSKELVDLVNGEEFNEFMNILVSPSLPEERPEQKKRAKKTSDTADNVIPMKKPRKPRAKKADTDGEIK